MKNSRLPESSRPYRGAAVPVPDDLQAAPSGRSGERVPQPDFRLVRGRYTETVNGRKLPPPLEEDLRVWTAALLSRGTAAPTPPSDDRRIIPRFFHDHGVEVLVADQVVPELLLPEWRARNETARNRAAAAELATEDEFVSVVKTLEQPARPIIFKGQSLAYSLYVKPWHRPRADIDIMIERAKLADVRTEFRQMGYRTINAIDGDLILRQTVFQKQQSNITYAWDVHWGISNRPALAEALSYEQLLESAIEVDIAGFPTLAPSHVHSLLIAGIHLIGHHSSDVRMIWLYDMHLLVHALSDVQRREFLSICVGHSEMRSACHAALSLTQRYMPSERTDELRGQLDPGPRAAITLEHSYLTRLLDDARALHRGQRSAFFRQHLFPSADYMVRRFGIRHRWQLPFWYGVRIARAVPKLFRRR